MSSDWIIRIVLFGLAHWALAGLLLNDLVSRRKVFGGRKAPWAIIIVIIPCFGSLIYLLFHPQILNPDHNQNQRPGGTD
jgi:hypothetical protein